MTPEEIAKRLMAALPPALRPHHPAPAPMPGPFLVQHSATEPITGKELHVMYHVIVPTEAFANVRLIASQTGAYNQGEGMSLEQRQAALAREAQGLREQIMEESERLRRDLSTKDFVRPVTSRTRSSTK